MSEDRYTVPALSRGLQLLMQFSRDSRVLSGAELSRRLDIPRASVFRMLQTLEQMNFVERTDDSGNYRLGLAVLRLGFEYLASIELTEYGMPVIEELRDQSGYSAHIVLRDQTEVVFVAKAPGRNAMFHSIQVGARLPAHATVLGRILLSDLNTDELHKLYPSEPLPAFTPKTPTTIEEVTSLALIDRERGYGISMAGFATGVSTIAAPVLNHHKKVVAAISISVPSSHIEEEELLPLIDMVKRAADKLSERIHHLP